MLENLILKQKNIQPVIVHEEKIKHFFGLITIWYLLEDRRPDMIYGDGQDKSAKYRHQISVCIFGKPVFSAIIRSVQRGFVGKKTIFEKEYS